MSALSSVSKAILRNPGGRHAAPGIKVTIFGCTGFLGRYVCSELGQMGCTMTLPYRGDENEVRHLKVMGDIGTIANVPFHPRDKDSVKEAVKGSDIVLNLVGKHYETKHLLPWWINFTYDDVHVNASRTIAEACAEENIPRLVHVSSLLAQPNSPSVWAASKYRGELAVRKAFPSATIVRPGQMFGSEDRLLTWIGERRSQLGCSPIIDGGKSVLSPVFVGDVAKALRALVIDETIDSLDPTWKHGRTFEFVGKDSYTRKELVEFVAHAMHVPPAFLDLPLEVAKIAGKVIQQAPNPIFTHDEATLWSLDQKKTSTLPGLEELDITPVSMEKEAMEFLFKFDSGGHFNSVSGYH